MDRENELLPVPYYHIVFTLPQAFNELLPYHAKAIYSSLFSASWSTIQSFAANYKYLGAKTGMISILHTCLPAVQDFGRRGGNNSGCIPMSTVLCQGEG
jgi:hypothetical protein